MTQYATLDDVRLLTTLVRTLQGDVNVLNTNVGSLSTLVNSVNHLSTLQDVTITYITEGDLLQYGKDGTWHNVSPVVLADYISGEGGIIDTTIVKQLIASEGSKLFLSKLYDDTANGVITFKHGIITEKMIYAKDGITIGNYQTGLLGSGAIIDKNGNIEAGSLTLREFLSVPELRFNRVDVVSGELWNSIAFGTIESVDVKNQIVTLKLEEGEYSGLHVNDICRGIYHNIDGVNNTTPGIDSAGFEKMQGFSTSYFTPIEILDEFGKRFRYALKPQTTQHPTANMKFAVYGNFLDSNRQHSAYQTRSYLRFLKNVNTWEIGSKNYASHFGKLEGINVPGAPDDGNLHGYGAYMDNVYITGAFIQFTPEQEESLKGEDAYSVNVTKDTLSVIVDNNMNILDEYNQMSSLTFGIQAFKGKTELAYSDVYSEGHYMATWEAIGCKVLMQNGVFTVTKITAFNNNPVINIVINCEGNTLFKREVRVIFHLQGNALWTTYNDNDAIPDRPTGDGTTNGWHRNYTASAIWMSTKSSRRVDDPTVSWSDPNRFRGASVAGKDGQYTRFAYTESSVTPSTPKGDTVPPMPSNPSDTCVWSMTPPQGDPEKGIWVWQSIQTVYSDKSTSGWSTPFRLTGSDGKDGNDGVDIEFAYKATNSSTAPTPLPTNTNTNDHVDNGWTDNPVGVTETAQYEWVTQRIKQPAKSGTGLWGNWLPATLWAKWGERGKDGDGYEYIYYRTTSENQIPDTPIAPTNQDEYLPKAFINGVQQEASSPGGAYWTDDPQGVRQDLMFEWVSTRKKTSGVWSNFQKSAIWAKWGETGLSGGNYIFKYKISKTKPQLPKPNSSDPNASDTSALEGWGIDDNLVPNSGEYVWSINRFKNPDGSLTPWTQLMRITGADGKDGEDGNSIEFLYARNNNNSTPPAAPNRTDIPQDTDWEGDGPDGILWFDNPQGVNDANRYEYVSQRYKDKSTQKWGKYSNPSLWSVFADKGKDGDGYEYIYATFADYSSVELCGKNELNYPASPSFGSAHIVGDYQADNHIPSKTCKGASVTYTDDSVNVSATVPYQICWSRKKKNGVWGDWSDGFIWTHFGKDGEEGPQGNPGKPGVDGSDAVSYSITPATVSVRLTRTGAYEPSSLTFTAYSKTGVGTISQIKGYWTAFGSNVKIPTNLGDGTLLQWVSDSPTFTFDIASKTKYKYYLIAFHPTMWAGDGTGGKFNPVAASASMTVVEDGANGADGSDANSLYVDVRFRGVWRSDETYYYTIASNIGLTDLYVNPTKAYVRDQVIYKGGVYIRYDTSKPLISGANYLPTNTTYWKLVSKADAMAINTLLADNAYLGAFNFSNNMFWSGDGGSANAKLFMNSATGEFRASYANITGTITATSGTFNGTINATGGIFNSVDIVSGKIANFTISGNYIGAKATADGEGGELSINPDFIRVGSREAYVMIGRDTAPFNAGNVITVTNRIVNRNTPISAEDRIRTENYGIYVDVKNAEINYALYSPNAAVRASAVYGDTINVVNIRETGFNFDLTKGNIIMLNADKEYLVNLPSSLSIQSIFNYAYIPQYFAIHVRIIMHPNSRKIRISGYCKPNNSTNLYTYLSAGNSMGFLLTNYPNFRWIETDYAT